jgi:hypothetical protein
MAPVRRYSLLLFLVCLHVSCSWGLVNKVDYRLPRIVTAPIGHAATDATKAFAETFCATLAHLDGPGTAWGSCEKYIETQVGQQSPAAAPIPTDLKVMIVGGAFSNCFEAKGVIAFEQGLRHLETHGLITGSVQIGGTATPEVNAEKIAAYLGQKQNAGDYIAIGHSKGAVDLMTAVEKYESARTRIKALVSIAGAISGSRLADLGPKATILGFQSAARKSGLGNCPITDEGGIDSLRRRVRYDALQGWHPPASLRTYSVVGVTSRDDTSSALHTMWDRNAYYSIDEDSQMIAEEAIIPGAVFLGVAKGDHWALALPFSEHPVKRIRDGVNRNLYPRTALLEAIVRYVHATRSQ